MNLGKDTSLDIAAETGKKDKKSLKWSTHFFEEENQKYNTRKDILLSNLKLENINPVSCGQHYCGRSHCFGPSVRSYYLLHYVVSGEGIFYSHNKEYKLSRGNIFVIRPDETTVYQASDENPWFYRWVGFTSSLDLSITLSEDVICAPECDYLFRMMVGVETMNVAKEYYICAKIFELLSLLSHNEERVNNSDSYVEMAKYYIETNYNCFDISISDIADNLNLDRSYFSTLFRKHAGKSPQEYLLDFRMNKAAEMLAVGTLKSGDVGKMCGYSNPFHFSKMFKRRFGVSPSQYSNMQKDKCRAY